jgi:hypothetical protein
MIDKKLYKPASIQRWIVVIYERKQRFSESAADDMVAGLRRATSDMGTLFYFSLVPVILSPCTRSRDSFHDT